MKDSGKETRGEPAEAGGPFYAPSSRSVGDWLHMLWDRFGFLAVSLIVVGAAGALYLKGNSLLPEPESWTPANGAIGNRSDSVAVTVNTNPAGAAVFVDGDSLGISPLRRVMLSVGTHQVVFRKTSYETVDTTLDAEGATVSLDVLLHPDVLSPREPTEDLAADPMASPQTASPAPTPEVEATISDADDQIDSPETDAGTPVGSPEADTDAPVESPEEEALPIPVGGLNISSEPLSARVFLDGEEVGRSPLVLGDVDAGVHQVIVRHDGHAEYRGQATVEPGTVGRVHAVLEPLAGTLELEIRPEGTVMIDGEVKQENAQSYRASLPPGSYRVRVEHARLGRWEQVVRIDSGQTKSVDVDFEQ